ncbi:MAG TPA: replication-relaxation family protein, partial [Candidatus Nitrosocosmicus sp.]|nr:replication-relaxation family protein [Candidatus Nitrosocosmicus sp.]
MILPPYTKSQREIIYQLYKFRYLLIRQLQQILNHKDPKRIKEWLKDLKKKRYINIIKDEHDPTKPYIICLAQKAKHILVQEEGIDLDFLNRLYKEKNYSEDFMNRHLFIADMYLYFLETKKEDTELSFFTQRDLKEYDYFPEQIPDAYIDLQDANGNSRYFVDYFDEKTQPGNIKYRVKTYLKYLDSKTWQKNTNNTPFPGVLMVFDNKYRRKFAYHYVKALLKKR